ncbi:MAG: glycosyltransferase, partial [Solirubrobacteraceae bacterium]
LDGEAEFLFVDGGSSDDSVAILRELAALDDRVRVLENPARRTPHALNIGLRAARGRFIARMDAHTIYPPRYLSIGIERLRRGGVDWVSGPALPVGRDHGSRRVARALEIPLGRGGARFRDRLEQEHEVDTGFVGIWLRETLERHAGWDEEWHNDQDMELAARIRKAGGRIVCIPEMAAQYVPRSTLEALARQYGTYGMFRVKTARRHPESLRRSQLLPPGVAVTVAAAVAAPSRGLRRSAQAGALLYAATLVAAGIRGARDEVRADAVTLPIIWAVMHLSYGVGFLRACVIEGPPLKALAGAVRPDPQASGA